MTKREIAKKISEQSGITALVALEVVQLVFDGIIETLVDEGRIELRNFGVFEVKRRRARKARNPRTGEGVNEAGCHDAESLSHCRGPGPHVRGCWLSDLILGEK
jgi:nucleoid DNA-binding protein